MPRKAETADCGSPPFPQGRTPASLPPLVDQVRPPSFFKICSTCKLEFTLDNFQKNSASADGLSWVCKACTKIVRRASYLRNQAAQKAASAKYAKAHKAQRAASSKAYYRRNREKCIEHSKAYYRAHREARMAYSRAYYRAHYKPRPARTTPYSSTYYAANREAILARAAQDYRKKHPKMRSRAQ